MNTLITPPRPIVRPADLADFPFIQDLQIKLREALGWISNHATDFRLQNGDVNAVEENGDIAGFLLSQRRLKHAPHIHPIYQAAIHYDLQRRHHGLALVANEEAKALANRCTIVTLWCAADLAANDFWRSAGYTSCGIRTGGKARGRTHILWRKPLTPDALQHLWTNQHAPNNGPGGTYRHGNTARTTGHVTPTHDFHDPDLQLPTVWTSNIPIIHPKSAR